MIDIALKAPIGRRRLGRSARCAELWHAFACRARTAGKSSGDEPRSNRAESQRQSAHAPLQVLGFTLDELRDARLAPIVDFKGRGKAGLNTGLRHWMDGCRGCRGVEVPG